MCALVMEELPLHTPFLKTIHIILPSLTNNVTGMYFGVVFGSHFEVYRFTHRTYRIQHCFMLVTLIYYCEPLQSKSVQGEGMVRGPESSRVT